MEELRLAFLVIGACAIIGILVHGLWTVRKNSGGESSARLEPRDWRYEDDNEADEDAEIIESDKSSELRFERGEFDDLGLGAVRIVSDTQKQAAKPQSEQQQDNGAAQQPSQQKSARTASEGDDLDLSEQGPPEPKEQTPKPQPKIYSSVVTQPKPQYAAEQLHAMRSKMLEQERAGMNDIPEPPPFLLKTDSIQASNLQQQEKPQPASPEPLILEPQEQKTSAKAASSVEAAAEKLSLAEQARNFVKRSKTEPKAKKRKEPQIREDQMRIDFDEPETSAATDAEAGDDPSAAQEVLVLNVKAPTDKPIQGAALLPMLLTMGLKFGDQDIFHRHVNSNGKGPVLFSLANMFKPGVFDIDNLETFTTQGVSLFMMLPIEGDPHQVFNMMHNAARKIADEFSAQVLDGRRSALTKQSLQQYVEKIREFERRRMIAR